MTDQVQQPQQQPEAEFNFTFKVSQINLIIAGLDEIPHKYSRPMIDEITRQIQGQQQQQPEGPLGSKVIQ